MKSFGCLAVSELRMLHNKQKLTKMNQIINQASTAYLQKQVHFADFLIPGFVFRTCFKDSFFVLQFKSERSL